MDFNILQPLIRVLLLRESNESSEKNILRNITRLCQLRSLVSLLMRISKSRNVHIRRQGRKQISAKHAWTCLPEAPPSLASTTLQTPHHLHIILHIILPFSSSNLSHYPTPKTNLRAHKDPISNTQQTCREDTIPEYARQALAGSSIWEG